MSNNTQASWRPMIVIALSMVMMYITSFSVNVLITEIVTDLKTSVANLQFVIVAASLIAGSLMVTAGRLGDKFGKKKIIRTLNTPNPVAGSIFNHYSSCHFSAA